MSRLKEISKLKSKLFFTIEDLVGAFGVKPESARVLCSRYVKNGLFVRLKNNFYVLEESWQDRRTDYFLKLSNFLQVPSYVSLMTALSYHGVSTQVQRNFYESVSLRRSWKLEVKGARFNFYKLKKEHYFGYLKKGDIFMAMPEKAFTDAVYLDSFGKYKLDYASIDLAKLDKSRLRSCARKFPDKTQSRIKKLCKI